MFKKDFIGDIVRAEPVDPESEAKKGLEEPEPIRLSRDSAEVEPEWSKPKVEAAPTSPAARSKPKISFPKETFSQSQASSSVLYVQARRVAELKFQFYKTLFLAVPINALFFVMAYLEIQPTGRFWFVWPLAISGAILLFQYLRAFILKGRNIQGMVEGMIHDMAVEEARRVVMQKEGESE